MRELTIQAQNDTLTPDDRMMIQNEFRQLQLAVDRSPEEARSAASVRTLTQIEDAVH